MRQQTLALQLSFEKSGRRPGGLAIMVGTYFMQQWFNLSDPGVEEAFYESSTLRRFAGMDLGVAAAPDETTVLRFQHLLEKHDLGGQMLDAVNVHLESKGIRIATGTIVDATIIHAFCSTKKDTTVDNRARRINSRAPPSSDQASAQRLLESRLCFVRKLLIQMVDAAGIEPATSRLRVECSTS